ncbi:hypothetical protein [Campylobacter helveticus]|uniref:hypothetical protein n=1 Tax=Campylobacter helveticus TaxID=28898 RepID=UPI00214A3CEF|nr:hypothetical protein [Campylobacter helveticus]MCR2066414.1 hypothetical protein [Campylobacter helveticus]
MALIEVCGKLIDTKIKFSGKPALDFAIVALEKEKIRQKEEEKKAVSVEYSEEYLSIKTSKVWLSQESGENTTQEVENPQKSRKATSTLEVAYSKVDLKLDMLI